MDVLYMMVSEVLDAEDGNAGTGLVLRIYGTEPAPASADDAVPVGATLLCELTDNGGGDPLYLATPEIGTAVTSDKVVTKASAQVWKGTNAETGTALWWRLCDPSDDGSAAADGTWLYRIQGTCGTSSADMLMASTTLTSGEEFILNNFVVAFPTL
jgi:hypothetical protein